ncbi:zinc-binding dehydrogenase [Nocardioides sp. GY 10127]|uniref:zinc-dependent alcohol dehydrogenase n=1 Tax=Nocardioides sp. GY 10127 TaxID=2569762 RepID=UPI0010A83326|nr:zinc-binding dehydrogenase [Nocardioides sp. GY 10127]TIC85688.1 hypothetical protein E8D37_03510 [Nocardioides sp. GY 10127]
MTGATPGEASGEASGGLMPAVYVEPDGALSVRRLPVPVPGEGEVLLRTLASALCGSDLHRFRGSHSYGEDTDVFGHESFGEVLACPSGALAPGTRVLHLPFPAEGRVCAPYQAARESQLLPMPSHLDPEVAVFAQQLGTVVHGLRTFLGDAVLEAGVVPAAVPAVVPAAAFVCGAGPAGLLFVQLLRALGCADVQVSEPVPHRLALALALGAREAPAERAQVPFTVDASGTPEGRRECYERTARGGTMGVFGLPDDEPGDLAVSVLDLLHKDLRLVGAQGAQSEPGLTSFRHAIRLLAEGTLDPSPLVSHVVDVEDVPAAAHAAAHAAAGTVKVLVVPGSPRVDLGSGAGERHPTPQPTDQHDEQDEQAQMEEQG